MDATGQALSSGDLLAIYKSELAAIHKENLFSRLWAQDVSLWPSGESGLQHIKTNLEFLHIPERLEQLVGLSLQTDAETKLEGLTHRIIIAFGSVHHFCKALLNIHPLAGGQKCIVMDSCHPDSIRLAESEAESAKTLVVLVNKSGYRLEDHSLFLYFQRKLQAELPGPVAGHFVAATEPNTFLKSAATQYGFRFVLQLPAGILPPYCSVIHLAILLVSLANVQPEMLRVACQDMRKQYTDERSLSGNPVCELAALLSATAKGKRLFLNFVASTSLAPFASALCRLIGGSIGRERGLFPIAMTTPCTTHPFEAQSSFIILKNAREEEPHLEECSADLKKRGLPLLEMRVANPLDLLRLTYRWQMATVLAAARMGIDPFDDSEVRLPRTLAAEMINDLSPRNDTLQRRPRIREGNIQLFAEARARQEISQLNLTECLVSLFEHRRTASYLGLFVFLEQSKEKEKLFGAVREELSQTLGLPVLLAWGPRSLDTHSYFLRDGAPHGLILVITSDPQFDVKIPGAEYSFGQLYRALSLALFEAWSVESGLALRLHLGSQTPESLSELTNTINQALRRVAR